MVEKFTTTELGDTGRFWEKSGLNREEDQRETLQFEVATGTFSTSDGSHARWVILCNDGPSLTYEAGTSFKPFPPIWEGTLGI